MNDKDLILQLTAKGLEPCSMDKSPGGNWVQEAGGLPAYICNVAQHMKGTTSQKIAQAISTIKRWIADPNTSAETKAKASAAIAEWNAKRAKAKATPNKVAATEIDRIDAMVLQLSDPIEVLKEKLSLAESNKPYGDVKYADPKNGKYPLNSEKRCRAAWAYINMPENAAKYPLNGVTLSSVKARIKAALKKYGVEISAT